MSYLLLLLGVTIGSIAQIPLKLSAARKRIMSLSYFVNKYTIFGYVLMLTATGFSFVAARNIDLKYVLVIESVSYINILIIGSAIFKEYLKRRQIIACIVILFGIVVFSL